MGAAGMVAGVLAAVAALGAAPPALANPGETGPASGNGSASGIAPAEQPDPRLARFHQQKLTWHKCALDDKDDLGKNLDAVKARCAEVIVPADYTQPDGRTIKVAISRRKATDTAHRLGTLVVNTGGPGESISGPTWVVRGEPGFFVAPGAPEVAKRYDLVGVDPRLHSRSTPLECGWPAGLAQQATLAGVDRATFDRAAAASRDLAARCASQKDLLPHASTRDIARDLNVIRAVLGEPKISYLGWSYGAYLGAVFTQMFPDRADRVVIDSAVNPHTWGATASRDSTPAMDAALKTWAAWVAGHDKQYHLGRTTAQVLAAVDRIFRAAEQGRLRIGKYQVPAGDVVGWLGVTSRERFFAQGAPIMQALHDAARGRKVSNPDIEQWLAGFDSQEVVPGAAALDATICADRAVSRDPEAYWQDIQAHRADEPRFGPMNRMISACAFWPSAPAEPATTINTNHPVLITGATGDVLTPYAGQLAMHQALTGSRMVTLPDTIAHGAYLFEGNPCVDTTVNHYLLHGVLPQHDTTCPKVTPAKD